MYAFYRIGVKPEEKRWTLKSCPSLDCGSRKQQFSNDPHSGTEDISALYQHWVDRGRRQTDRFGIHTTLLIHLRRRKWSTTFLRLVGFKPVGASETMARLVMLVTKKYETNMNFQTFTNFLQFLVYPCILEGFYVLKYCLGGAGGKPGLRDILLIGSQ